MDYIWNIQNSNHGTNIRCKQLSFGLLNWHVIKQNLSRQLFMAKNIHFLHAMESATYRRYSLTMTDMEAGWTNHARAVNWDKVEPSAGVYRRQYTSQRTIMVTAIEILTTKLPQGNYCWCTTSRYTQSVKSHHHNQELYKELSLRDKHTAAAATKKACIKVY